MSVIKKGTDHSISDLLDFWNFWGQKHARNSDLGDFWVFLAYFWIFEMHDGTQNYNGGLFIVM